jgi:hypothetical protein
MPVKDVDGGLVWQGYNPSMFGYKQFQSKPFYFGGSKVPIEIGMKGSGISIPVIPKRDIRQRQVKKLPMIRKL